jgi:tetratricopeptide (TPR) repeat protein
MAGVDPYAVCPCGSGQKFKWCCQKMESYADRAQRLYETGQIEGALEVLDEGLRKEPANAWLLIRKALIQIREGMADEAKSTLRRLLERQPQHVAALSLLTRCVLETEGPVAGIAQLQRAMTTVGESQRVGLASMIAITGTVLARIGHYQGAMAHLALARRMTAAEGEEDRLSTVESSILTNPAILPWVKQTYRLSPAPAGLDAELARQFAEAVAWGESGLWSSAASAFEMLSASVPGPEADRNLGLCRLWQAEDAPAVEAFRRAVRKLGTSEEAVDLEALCQIVEPTRAEDRVENVQLIWPLRNRDALLATLRGQKDVAEEQPGPIDPNDPESPQVDQFILLDRPALAPTDGKGLKVEALPRIMGRVAVGREIAALEGYDDGSLDALSARFTALAGSAIAPAHPKTKVLAEVSRVQLALSWEWYPPEDLDPVEADRLADEQQSYIIREVWPKTKLPFLGGRTPLQAAEAGDAEVPLRAACCQFERRQESSRFPVDFAAFRARLRIAPEPEVDPEAVDLATLPYARFAYVPVDRLGDEKLIRFYAIARAVALNGPIDTASRALAARPELIQSGMIPAQAVYAELSRAAATRGSLDEALRLLDEGRRVESPGERAKSAPSWDMIEIAVRARLQPPEAWVPELAVVLDRYRDDPTASQVLMLNLLEMGLIQMAPNPDNPKDYLIDPRPLQALMAEYGPRVTTASGQLGVSATKGGLWTPGSEAGPQSGGIWTPGSSAPSRPGDAEKPKLIVPGR